MSRPNGERRTLVCNCCETMALDADRLGVPIHTDLCRGQLGAFEAALASGAPLVTCTQEAALFEEVAEAAGASVSVTNIRERAGWTDRPGDVNPKIAALLAEAALAPMQPRLLQIASAGHVLVLGRDQAAIEAAQELCGRMPAVSLVLLGNADLLLPETIPFPILRATTLRLSGTLGAFRLLLEAPARMDPSSRRGPSFGAPSAEPMTLSGDIVLDLTGDAPLVTGPHKRDGYERADPGSPSAVAGALLRATDFQGEFEKPIYVDYDASICAHSRNRITGCSKCLDACPAGAVAPDGDGVLIDALICAGCGSCAAHCPTGAVSYAAPPRDDLSERLAAMLGAYHAAGGERPVLLLHAEKHGGALVNASARLGRGLPVEVMPLGLHAATMPGHDYLIAAASAGAGHIVVLVDPARSDETDALAAEIELANAILVGLGHSGRASMMLEHDPDAMEDALAAIVAGAASPTPTPSVPSRSKREASRNAFAALGGGMVEPFPLPAHAPYGRIHVDPERCTLCMACVSACPADAIRDNPDSPELRFVEAACVQCSICARTCPENAIVLEQRLDPRPAAQAPVILHAEEPADCIRCGKPFAAASTVERMVEKLSGHWMYSGERADLLRMCDHCRLEAASEGGRDPFAVGQRPAVRRTEDYLKVEDFLSD